MNKTKISQLANSLNFHSAQLKAARKDLSDALTRIESTEKSILVIQDAFFKEINKKDG